MSPGMLRRDISRRFIIIINACMLPRAPPVDVANSILIGSAALAELVVMTYRQTKLDAGRTVKPDVQPPTSRLCQQQQILVGRRFSRDRETNFRLFIHSHSSINPENLAKIGPVDFAIIGLTGIGKKYLRNSSTTGSPQASFQQLGGLNH